MPSLTVPFVDLDSNKEKIALFQSGQLDLKYLVKAGLSGGQTAIGGTAVTDILKLQGTSGNGTLTSPAIQALVGNNGATTALTILNNGNVGIGTTNPGAKLEIQGSSVVSLQLSNDKRIAFKDTGGNTIQTIWYNSNNDLLIRNPRNSADSDIHFYVKDGTKMTIDSNGNVGIGIIAPTQKLDVSGNINFNTNGTAILMSSFKGADSVGNNLFIGGGGQSSIGEAGATHKGSYNTSQGYAALNSNTTGYYNSAQGYAALYSNTTGNYNSAQGM